MFKHILVPLDGSKLAEAALPAARLLAQKMNAKVSLVHIIEQNAAPEIHGDRHLTAEKEALEYLEQTAQAFFPGLNAVVHLHTQESRNIARSIIEHIAELSPDLIIMCTHGKGGLRDWMTGSIAQRVIGERSTPVLLIQPVLADEPHEIRLERFTIALDGDPEHEQGFQAGVELAKLWGAGLDLVLVIPNQNNLTGQQAATKRFLPGVTAEMLNCCEPEALEYLKSLAAPKIEQGIPIQTQVRRGDPAQEIIHSAEENHSNLIVLGTHGKAGMNAFWAGSVAPKITTSTHIPILLVPAK